MFADLPPMTIVRRLALWLLVCAVSAAPSFVLAQNANASPAGMIAAVVAFALLYACASCTRWFERVRRRPFIRATIYVGYGLRLGLSLLMAASLADRDTRLLYAIGPDLFCGFASLKIVSTLAGESSFERVAITFAGAFATTCVQGAILNAIIFAVMGVAYGLQRAFRKPPPETVRGFEVVPIE